MLANKIPRASFQTLVSGKMTGDPASWGEAWRGGGGCGVWEVWGPCARSGFAGKNVYKGVQFLPFDLAPLATCSSKNKDMENNGQD